MFISESVIPQVVTGLTFIETCLSFSKILVFGGAEVVGLLADVVEDEPRQLPAPEKPELFEYEFEEKVIRRVAYRFESSPGQQLLSSSLAATAAIEYTSTTGRARRITGSILRESGVQIEELPEDNPVEAAAQAFNTVAERNAPRIEEV